MDTTLVAQPGEATAALMPTTAQRLGDFAGAVGRGISGSVGAAGKAFHAVLAKATDAMAAEKAEEKKANEAAAGLVSNALFLPVLKQIRRSTWGGKGVFSGGMGEQAFGPQFDMQLADRMANSPRLGVKKALAQRMLRHRSAGQATAAAGTRKGMDIHG